MQDLEIEDFGSDSGSSLSDSSGLGDADEEEIAQYLDTLQLPGIICLICNLQTYATELSTFVTS